MISSGHRKSYPTDKNWMQWGQLPDLLQSLGAEDVQYSNSHPYFDTRDPKKSIKKVIDAADGHLFYKIFKGNNVVVVGDPKTKDLFEIQYRSGKDDSLPWLVRHYSWHDGHFDYSSIAEFGGYSSTADVQTGLDELKIWLK